MKKEEMSFVKRLIYVGLGFAFLVLAYFGILMPGVPAIPFILLAAFFFANSSKKLHAWMMRQKLIAKIVSKDRTPKAHFRFKIFVISQFWVSITVAEFIFIPNILLGSITILIGILLSIAIYILMDRNYANGKK